MGPVGRVAFSRDIGPDLGEFAVDLQPLVRVVVARSIGDNRFDRTFPSAHPHTGTRAAPAVGDRRSRCTRPGGSPACSRLHRSNPPGILRCSPDTCTECRHRSPDRSFDFLGCHPLWGRSMQGKDVVAKGRFARALKSVLRASLASAPLPASSAGGRSQPFRVSTRASTIHRLRASPRSRSVM